MAQETYSTIERPYDSSLSRTVFANTPTSTNSDSKNVVSTGTSSPAPIETSDPTKGTGENGITGKELDNLWIKNFIKSLNYKPQTFGFKLDGITGDSEFNDVIVRGTIYATAGDIAGWIINATTINSPSDGIILDSANQKITVGSTAPITIDGVLKEIESDNYVSGVFGSGFHLDSNLLEVGNIACRGLIRSAVFQKDVVSTIGGNLAVLDGDTLDADMTALDASTLTVKGSTTFVVGDILRIKDGVDDEWLEVTNIGSAPTYTVTRDKAAAYASNSNPTWQKGIAVVNYGQSGDGGVYITASDTNAPYLSIFDHAGSPWSALTTRLRIGNLNGYLGYSTDLYGIAIGETGKSLSYDTTNGLRITGTITGGLIQTAASGQRFIIDSADNYAKGIDSNGNQVVEIGGGTSGSTRRLYVNTSTATDVEAVLFAATHTTGTATLFSATTAGLQIGMQISNSNTSATRTSSNIAMLRLANTGTGDGIQYIDNGNDSTGIPINLTMANPDNTNPMVRMTQNAVHGGIKTVSITNGGTGYTLNDVLTITAGTGGTVTASSVTAGVVDGITITTAGTGYATGSGQATTGGTGTGCTINITAIYNFRKLFSETNTSVVIWLSDGTTPNGNLSGTAGDICLNGTSGQAFYCTGTTNWTGM